MRRGVCLRAGRGVDGRLYVLVDPPLERLRRLGDPPGVALLLHLDEEVENPRARDTARIKRGDIQLL